MTPPKIQFDRVKEFFASMSKPDEIITVHRMSDRDIYIEYHSIRSRQQVDMKATIPEATLDMCIDKTVTALLTDILLFFRR